MLRIIASQSVKQAKSYYTVGLKQEALGRGQGKYYLDEQEQIGEWRGQGAERLNLKGRVDQKAFEQLCDNINPTSGRRLTVRTKQNRRVGYDFNFHCPKSVSVVQALTGDERILSAFQKSVTETMEEIEDAVSARVRTGGATGDRWTGNLIWGEFTHFTARPVAGKPDPHLHSHCFAFNATWDWTEKKWKAGEFGQIKHDGPYYESLFLASLGKRLSDLGYSVERTKSNFEIRGVPQSLIKKFSQRTQQIEEKAVGITDPKVRSALGARTRAKKVKRIMTDLKDEWMARLTSEEQQAIARLYEASRRGGYRLNQLTPRQAMDFALEHCLENASVVSEKKLIETALRHGMGQVEVSEVKRERFRSGIVNRDLDGQSYCTTHEILGEEWACVQYVKDGRGMCSPLNPDDYLFSNQKLSDEQKGVVRHVIGSRDRVIAIRGAAGTGKTTMMQEAVKAIESGGRKVFTFAPSAEASRGVLRKEGFGNAQTVAHLLENSSLQEQVQGQVLWIDEAGLLSSRQMRGIFDLAKERQCRVVLSGDTLQNTPVERGDALRILELHAGIESASLTVNRRQKGEKHREAVACLRQGRSAEGLKKLEELNALVEISSDTERYQRLSEDYVQAVIGKKEVIVVSPTHAEGLKVTQSIRERLRQVGKIGIQETPISKLQDLHWSVAQRREAHLYQEGMEVQFHREAKGFDRGERAKVTGRDDTGRVWIKNTLGEKKQLPLDQPGHYQVYEIQNLGVAVGDKIRITRNGQTLDGHALSNGQVYQIKGLTPEGDLRLANHWVIPKNYGHLAHGYCVTSYTSQGKTVDEVLIAQASQSSRAAFREQFYVSASRFRESIRIYTDDKEALGSSIVKSCRRVSALDLIKGLRLGKVNLTPRQSLWRRIFQVSRKWFSEKLRVPIDQHEAVTPRHTDIFFRPKVIKPQHRKSSFGMRM